jgi:hypothetical protein
VLAQLRVLPRLFGYSGADGHTYDQFYAEARRRNIRSRSSMNKAELKRKLGR